MRIKQLRVRVEPSDLGAGYRRLDTEIRDDAGQVYHLRQDHHETDFVAFFDAIWEKAGTLLKESLKNPPSTGVPHS